MKKAMVMLIIIDTTVEANPTMKTSLDTILRLNNSKQTSSLYIKALPTFTS